MAEGFPEVKNILAERGLTHCPPITPSDLEEGTSRSNTSTSAGTSSGSSNRGEVVVPPKNEMRSNDGDGPEAEGFADPSDGGGQQSLHPF